MTKFRTLAFYQRRVVAQEWLQYSWRFKPRFADDGAGITGGSDAYP